METKQPKGKPTYSASGVHYICFFCGALSVSALSFNGLSEAAVNAHWKRVVCPGAGQFRDEKRWVCQACRGRHRIAIEEATKVYQQKLKAGTTNEVPSMSTPV